MAVIAAVKLALRTPSARAGAFPKVKMHLFIN